MEAKPFCAGDVSKAKVLIIGHDPRLQESHTIAEYAFFADYYFRPIPTRGNERAKYRLAEAVFNYIGHLTNHRYSADQIVLTNLCSAALPHAPKGRVVFIPEHEAQMGINAIRGILSQNNVEVIFAMSEQVNYWLQRLDFYPAVPEFINSAEPKTRGVDHQPPYYEPKRGRAFQLICGKRYHTEEGQSVFPVLHVKSWPLRGAFAKAYAKAYENCINELKRR